MRDSRRLPGRILGCASYLVEYMDGKEWKHRWRNAADPLRFVAAVGDRILTPPDRFVHDFASIPPVGWQLVGPPSGHGPGANYGPAAILHDWAYEHQHWDNGEPLTRQQADALIWEAMFHLGVDEWRADLMYGILRVFGGPHWNKHKTGRIPCPSYGSGWTATKAPSD